MIIPEDGCLPKITRSNLAAFSNIMIIKVPEHLRQPGETAYQLATLDRTKKGEKWPADECLDKMIFSNTSNVSEFKDMPDSNPQNTERNTNSVHKNKKVFRRPAYKPRSGTNSYPQRLPRVMSTVPVETSNGGSSYTTPLNNTYDLNPCQNGLLGDRPEQDRGYKNSNMRQDVSATKNNRFYEGACSSRNYYTDNRGRSSFHNLKKGFKRSVTANRALINSGGSTRRHPLNSFWKAPAFERPCRMSPPETRFTGYPLNTTFHDMHRIGNPEEVYDKNHCESYGFNGNFQNQHGNLKPYQRNYERDATFYLENDFSRNYINNPANDLAPNSFRKNYMDVPNGSVMGHLFQRRDEIKVWGDGYEPNGVYSGPARTENDLRNMDRPWGGNWNSQRRPFQKVRGNNRFQRRNNKFRKGNA